MALPRLNADARDNPTGSGATSTTWPESRSTRWIPLSTVLSYSPPITQTDLDKFFRPDLNDAYWMPSTLPDATLKETFRR